MEECEAKSINYEIECERLREQLKKAISELEIYKQALLKVCIRL